MFSTYDNTGELGYDRLNGTRIIGPSFAKSVIYIWHIWHILDMHGTGTKHVVRHRQKSVIQRSVISKFACINNINISTDKMACLLEHHKLKYLLQHYKMTCLLQQATPWQIFIPNQLKSATVYYICLPLVMIRNKIIKPKSETCFLIHTNCEQWQKNKLDINIVDIFLIYTETFFIHGFATYNISQINSLKLEGLEWIWHALSDLGLHGGE